MEQPKTVCRNPWCKATFYYTEEDMVVSGDSQRESNINSVLGDKVPPKYCKKCQSFDRELSAGVEWKDKEYEGSRWDDFPHHIKYKVTTYRQ